MKYCPSCLKENYSTYCSICKKKLFGGNKVHHILPFTRPEFDQIKRARGGRLSISGIQIKHSLKLIGSDLVLTERGGEFILKPIPSGQFENLNAVPANEHVTMQIARQVFNVNVAENAIVFFADNEIAYITKRFDVLASGKNLLQEDFAQIAQRTEDTHGQNYKYDISYEEIAMLMKKHVAAYSIEIEKLYKIILYNYLICNGDAHLKNFSLYRNEKYGDYLLTPFYDLINTSIHVPGEGDTALKFFKDDFMSEGYKFSLKYKRDDFYVFGIRIGIKEKRMNLILNNITSKVSEIKTIVNRCFLENNLKEKYIESVGDRINRLVYSFGKDDER